MKARPARPVLLLIGPLPEPRGGVSVHIERLGRLLSASFRIHHADESPSRKPGMFNLRSLNVFRYLARIGSSDFVHVHSGLPALRLLHVACSRALGKRTFATIHGCTFIGDFGAMLDRVSARIAHAVIVVDEACRDRLGLKKKAIIRSAFIPPSLEHEPELPADVRGWITRQRGLRRRIVAANAWRLDIHHGADLYGLDLCIELVRRLKEKGAGIAFIFAVSSLGGGRGRFDRFGEHIRALGLQDEFLLRHGPLSFPRLIREADCVLRPTRADGDSLTVREALYFGKPVIASDAAARPAGVRLFKSGDADDLMSKLMDLPECGAGAATLDNPVRDDLEFYRGLYECRGN